MNLELIEVKNIKKSQTWQCDGVLLPTEAGQKWVDMQSQKIVTDVVAGTMEIQRQEEKIPIELKNNGIGYFNGKSLIILIK
jgi:hypothetical protein